MNAIQKLCPTCGGSGQIGFFQGVSRFFITREECPACYGVGQVVDEEPAADRGRDAAKNNERDRDASR